MSLGLKIFVLIIFYIFAFWIIRYYIWGVKMYLFNKSAYKKHKKGESFKGWLFYSRYPQMMPKILLMPYYVVLILHPIVILLCVCLEIMEMANISECICRFVVIHDFAWACLIAFIFTFTDASRWLPKPKYHGKGK